MIHCPLYNWKQILGVTVSVWSFIKTLKTPIQPPMRQLHRFESIFIFGIGWGALIKSHHDICSYYAFYVHYLFRSKKMLAAIYMTVKHHTFFIDLSISSKGKYLKSSAIGKNRLIPIYKLMQASCCF